MRPTTDAEPEGGDPPCWAHQFEDAVRPDQDGEHGETPIVRESGHDVANAAVYESSRHSPSVERLTVAELGPPPGYAHVAAASGARLVLTAGAVPLDGEGNLVGAGDVRLQARQTLDNLMRQLAAAGAGGDDVLKTTVYVASTDRADLVAVWEEVQGSPIAAAASTLLGVALLGYPDQVVEIEVIAALP